MWLRVSGSSVVIIFLSLFFRLRECPARLVSSLYKKKIERKENQNIWRKVLNNPSVFVNECLEEQPIKMDYDLTDVCSLLFVRLPHQIGRDFPARLRVIALSVGRLAMNYWFIIFRCEYRLSTKDGERCCFVFFLFYLHFSYEENDDSGDFGMAGSRDEQLNNYSFISACDGLGIWESPRVRPAACRVLYCISDEIWLLHLLAGYRAWIILRRRWREDFSDLLDLSELVSQQSNPQQLLDYISPRWKDEGKQSHRSQSLELSWTKASRKKCKRICCDLLITWLESG